MTLRSVALLPESRALRQRPHGGTPQTRQTPLYKVVDGYKVDANTMKGFRAWRAAACDRCHGANQEGLVGPSLINSLKTLSKEEFVKIVRDGRLDKGMQSFGNSQIVMDNIDQLYAYLKGRSDGAITRAKVEDDASNDCRGAPPCRCAACPRAGRWRGLPLRASRAGRRRAPRKALRVCQDPNNLPFSNTKGEGIENRIAELFAQGARTCRWSTTPSRSAWPSSATRCATSCRRGLPLRHRDGRAGGLRPGVGHQALLPLDLRAGLSARARAWTA